MFSCFKLGRRSRDSEKSSVDGINKYNRYETTTVEKKKVIYLIPLKTPKLPTRFLAAENVMPKVGGCHAPHAGQSSPYPTSSPFTPSFPEIHTQGLPACSFKTPTDGGKAGSTDDTGFAEILCSTRRSGYDSSSVSVFVALVSSSSSSVPLSSSESSSTLRRGLGVWPVLRTCIWPARESGNLLAHGHT